MTAARRHAVGGFVTLQHLLAVGISLIVFTMLANVLVVQYARAVGRAAVDDGARAGARVAEAESRCLEVAGAAVRGLTGPGLRGGITVTCRADAVAVTASAQVEVAGWLPGIRDFRSTQSATVGHEGAP